MLQVHTCVSVQCDQCGDSPGGPAVEAHYPSAAAARDAAAARGWRVGPGGHLWCSACGPVLACEREGHEFTGWHQLLVGEASAVIGDEAGGGNRGGYRYCRRCCLHESQPVIGASVSGGDCLTGSLAGDGPAAAVRARSGAVEAGEAA